MRVLSRPVHLLSVSALLCTLVATLPVAPVPPSDHGIVSSTRIIPLPGPVLPTHAATARPQRAPDAPMVPGTHWYLAAQYVAPGARVRQEVAFLNPNAVPVPVTIAVYIARYATPIIVRLTLRAGVSRVFDLDNATRGATLGSTQVALSIVSPRVISVQRVLVRRQRDGRPFGVDITPGVPAPSRTWSFPEGYVGLTYQETLTLFNPGPRAARVTVRFAPQGHGPSPVAPIHLSVPAFGQQALNVRRAYRRGAPPSVGLLVASSQPVVAGRTLYWGANGDAGQFGADAKPGLPAPSTRWYAAGASLSGQDQPFVALVAPGGTARATVEVRDARGHLFILPRALIPSGHRATILLARGMRIAGPIALVVRADRPILVEVPQYSAGSPNVGRHAGDVISAVADVAPYAHLPYLRTDRGVAAALITVYNPGRSALTVTVRGFTASGRTAARAIVVPAGGTVLYDVTALNLPRGPLGVTLAATRDGFVAYAQSASGVASTFVSEEAIPLPAVALTAVQGPGPQPPIGPPLAGLPHATATLTAPNPAASTTATSLNPAASATTVSSPATTPIASDTPASGGLTLPTATRTTVPSATAVPSSSPTPPPPARTTPAPAPRLTLALTAPVSVTPGMAVPYVMTVSNVSTSPATRTVVTLTFPDGTSSLLTLGAVAPGATVTGTLSWVVPAVPAKGVAEADADYLTRLGQADGASLTVYATLSWQDATGAPSGPVAAQAASTEHLPILQYTAVSGPDTLVPGTVVTTTVRVRNTGSGDASAVTARVRNPDGSISGAQGGPVASGAATTLDVSWLVPTMPHATTERDDAYAARLTAEETQTQPFTVGLGWHDERLNSYGQIGAARTATERVPVVAIAIDGPQTPAPGTTVTYTVSLTNTGSVPAALLNLSVVMPDSTPRVPDAGSALGPGESRQVTIPYTVPLTLPAGAFVAHARVTWQDSAQNAYGPRAADAATTVADEPELQIGLDGPATATTGDTITYIVTLTNTASSTSADAVGARVSLIFPDRSRRTVDVGDAIASGTSRSLPVTFTIPTTQTVGDAPALAAVTWRDDAGHTLGPREASTVTTIVAAPTATATAIPTDTPTSPPTDTPSPAASPTPGVVSAAIEQITGSFFPNPSNSGAFVTSPSARPAFSEQFPVIDFNPPGGASTFCTNSTGVNEGTRPFADVVPKPDGTCAAQVAQSADGLSQAGAGNLGAFQAVFTSTLDVTGTGYATFNFFSDDGWVFSIGPSANGDQPSYYSGAFANPPPSGPFTGYKVVGSYNTNSSPAGNNVTVYFPRGGRYPVELDYTECCEGQLSFTVNLNAQSIPSAPTDTPTPLPTDTPTVGPTDTPGPSATPTIGVQIPGCIASPGVQSTVSGQVPIVLVAGETLQQGSIDYWPADNPNSIATISSTVQGGGTIGTLDTTTLADGTYVIRVRGIDTAGSSLTCESSVIVVGENKPGRLQFTVTDLTVPVGGLPISINRTYDSLERSVSGDFGYGWSLGLYSAHLKVDPANDVTLTLPDGKRTTFYFTPTRYIFGFEVPGYTPESGVHGSLTSNGCSTIVSTGDGYSCFLGFDPSSGGNYVPTTYTYTDPHGVIYTYGADGAVRSVRDVSGVTLTVGPDGIVSSRGDMVVPFTRDARGRITTITLPDGSLYRYNYDDAGDLVGIDLPGVAAPAGYAHALTYSYDPSHLFLGAVDPRGNHVATTTYYPDGRLKTTTDANGNLTQTSYDVPRDTTVVTYPDGGVDTSQTDAYGMVISETDPLSRTTTYAYSPDHDLTRKTDASGTTNYTYDGSGNVTGLTVPGGLTTQATYNQYSGLSTLTDARGNVTSVTVDGSNLPQAISDSQGVLGTYSFDSAGDPLTRTDSNGAMTVMSYDSYGNEVSETNPSGYRTTFSYDENGRQLTRTDALSNTAESRYDDLGHIVATIDPLHQLTRSTYNGSGQLIAETDPAGRMTRYTYDAAGHQAAIYYPDGSSETDTYDWRGNVLTHVDQDGHETVNTYDLDGEVISTTTAAGTADASTTSTTYDSAGHIATETDGRGLTTTFAYDSAGHLWHRTDPQHQTTTYTYDADGEVATVTDPANHTTRYMYGARGHVLQTTYADGTTMQQTYDGDGNALTHTDQAGRLTTYTFDGSGRLLKATDPLSGTTSYAYDAVGNVISTTDANGHVSAQAYDADGRQIGKTWPDGSTESYTYDPATGDQLTHQLSDGHVNAMTYDAMDRLTAIHYFDGQQVSFAYTPTGQRATVQDTTGVSRYTYDNQDRTIAVDAPGGRVSYTYDADGNQQSIATPQGITTYTYDTLNNVASVTDPSQQATTYRYDAAGNRSSVTYPNGVVVDEGYDALNRLTSIAAQIGMTPIASYTYTLNPNGQRARATEANGATTTWAYDGAGRLTGETSADAQGAVLGQTSYTYDAVGNRLTQTTGTQATTYMYNVLDQLTSNGATNYQYDGRGNLIAEHYGMQTTTYQWDAADRLSSVMLPDGTAIDYGYDADGRRASASMNGQQTRYLWDQTSRYGDVLAETDSTGRVRAGYTLANGTLVSETHGGTIEYYLQDGQQNVRALISQDGTVTDRYTYDAFGNEIAHHGNDTNPYLFAGQRSDTATGLYDMRARYYDPSVGRFLSRDPLSTSLEDTSQIDRYSYAVNDPVNHVDPSGQLAIPAPVPANPLSPGAGGAAIEYIGLVARLAAAIPIAIGVGRATSCLITSLASVLMAAGKDAPALVAVQTALGGRDTRCYIPIVTYRHDNSSLPPNAFAGPNPTPYIAVHIYTSQFVNGRPMLLTYLGSRDPNNYQAACGQYNTRRPPGPNNSCDEYPFATTVEGGANATCAGVPAIEQRRQGGIMSNFYQNYYGAGQGILPGQWFAAITWPLGPLTTPIPGACP